MAGMAAMHGGASSGVGFNMKVGKRQFVSI
jgi:hypothetical protein